MLSDKDKQTSKGREAKCQIFFLFFFYFDLRFFNATFNNLLVYLVRVIVLSMEETEVPREIPSTLRKSPTNFIMAGHLYCQGCYV